MTQITACSALNRGRTWDRLDIVSKSICATLTVEPIPPEELHTSRALRGETVSGEVLLITDGTGHDRYLRQNAAPIRGADGSHSRRRACH